MGRKWDESWWKVEASGTVWDIVGGEWEYTGVRCNPPPPFEGAAAGNRGGVFTTIWQIRCRRRKSRGLQRYLPGSFLGNLKKSLENPARFAHRIADSRGFLWTICGNYKESGALRAPDSLFLYDFHVLTRILCRRAARAGL